MIDERAILNLLADIYIYIFVGWNPNNSITIFSRTTSGLGLFLSGRYSRGCTIYDFTSVLLLWTLPDVVMESIVTFILGMINLIIVSGRTYNC